MRNTVILAAALMGCMAPPELRPREPTPGVPHLRVTTFNVDLKQYDDPETIEAIGAAGADVIALQETSAPWEPVVRARYGMEYPHIAFAGSGSGGLAILSKHPFEDRGVLDGVDDWHPAWHVVLDSDMGPIELLMVHLRPQYSKREGISGYLNVERNHLLEVQTFSRECDDETPTIILGDFNESVDGAAVEFLEDRGFTNVLPQYRPGQETWRYGNSLYGQAVDTIDHILYQHDALAPLNAFVEYEGNSDHLPVTALFELRSQPEG